MIRRIPPSIALLSVLLASGQVCHARVSGTEFHENVAIQEVTGGDRTNPRWDARIGNDDFRHVLARALDSSGLLATAKCEARYLLSAVLEDCSYPTAGYDVMTLVRYTLVDTLTGVEIFRDSIHGEGAMHVSDSFLMGKKSLMEYSIRANIRTLTERLLELDPVVQGAFFLP